MFLRSKNPSVRRIVSVPIKSGGAYFTTFHGLSDKREHLAISFSPSPSSSVKKYVPLVRIHSECLTGDVFGSAKCDCGDQLDESLNRLRAEDGVLLYLRQEGRGIGLYNKLDAYELQAQGLDTYEANRRLGFGSDERDYRVAAEMLKAMGVSEIRLLTNNPDKKTQLEAHGIRVNALVKTGAFVKAENRRYLEAKVRETFHRIDLGFSPVLR